RCADIRPVQVKSIEQQSLQALHRTRSLWMGTHTARINALRGFCREFGITIAIGARVGVEQVARLLADPATAIPALLRTTLRAVLEEIRLLELRIAELERELGQLAQHSPACVTLLSVPGVGLLTATAMVAATGGDVAHFQDARHFASWFGLTPKEHSSGNSRHLGRISKRGDRYLRMLLTHGARSVLQAATVAQRCHRPLDPLRTWALAVQSRTHRNKAVCALANKLARICYATLRDAEPYNGTQTVRRLRRSVYALTA
ncbi:MAG: IS110 family transposase, partial [Steroidobacteraceae bacterium]